MRALMALVVVLLVIAPPLDAAAHTAKQRVQAGDTAVGTRVLSAFDVVDDVLDHMPGDNANSHQLPLLPAFESTQADFPLLASLEVVSWPVGRDAYLAWALPHRIKRPPRI